MTAIIIVCIYLALLLVLGVVCTRYFRGTSADFFVASRSLGPFVLFMSIFGTTMTAFALVGSTSNAFSFGIGTYGLMASWSGLVHSAVFFLVGIKIWAIGKRYGFVTQCQYFTARFDSPTVGYLLFPILVALVIPYVLIGIMGAGATIEGITRGQFPQTFGGDGAIPRWLSGGVISLVVLIYVFLAGVRGAAWANTFQTIVFVIAGIIALKLIADSLGGPVKASQLVIEHAPEKAARQGLIGRWQFLCYMFVPLSVGMFPHLFQNWLTARSAKAFRLTVVAHPIFIMLVWLPCILIGIWAAAQFATGDLRLPRLPDGSPNANVVLAAMVNQFVESDFLTGLLAAGILAAIMSSLDSQFMCVGTMFTKDIVTRIAGEDRFSDRQTLWIGRSFVIAVVILTYVISLVAQGKAIFPLAVWCFSGYASLFPIVFASLYWRRTSKWGVIAAVLVTAGVWFYFFQESGYGDEHLLLVDWFEENKGLKHPVEGIMPVAVMFMSCLITLIVGSLLTPAPAKKTIDLFFPPALKGIPA